MYSIDELALLTEKLLGEVSIGPEPAGLYAPVEYVLEEGGKRVRPVMALMGCNVFRDDIRPAHPVAVAVEVFHNFTLLHDDIMDKAMVRRGRECVHLKWSENAAILSGDVMLILAYKSLAEVEPSLLPRVLGIFNRMAAEVCEGQQYDMDFELRKSVNVEEYMDMIRLKTSVLLAASLEMGAVVGGANQAQSDALYRFGIELGLAFQVQDDLLDLYADEKEFGKRIGGDILSGKKTFLLSTALKLAGDSDRSLLQKLITDKKMAPERKIAEVRSIYDRLGVREAARAEIDRRMASALEELEAVGVGAERLEPLRSMVVMLMDRKK